MAESAESIRFNKLQSQLIQMTESGLIGFYDQCEITEVLGFSPSSKTEPVNVFSVVVFEEGSGTAFKEPGFLHGRERLKVDGLKDWDFGVYRYHLSLDELNSRLNDYGETRIMELSGHKVHTGSLIAIPRQFVPPDATQSTPLNRVLKNNFRNGSYVFELFDAAKPLLSELFADSRRIQSLSEQVQRFVPVRLASLSDRLGNIIFQLPVNVLMCEFKFLGDQGMSASIAWEPRVNSRACRVVSLMEFDGVLNGFGISPVTGIGSNVETGDSSELNRCYLWDEEKELILAASGSVAAVRNINVRMHSSGVGYNDARYIVIPSANSSVRQEIFLEHSGSTVLIGGNSPFEFRSVIRKRISDVELATAEKSRMFVQYGRGDDKRAEKERGIKDLQYLIQKYGNEGAWLWDPFLSFADIMTTLFFCKVSGVPLYALGSFNKRTRDVSNPEKKQFEEWCKQQRQAFCTEGNNHRGLNFQFRCRHSGAGWEFHDRFLIFPRRDGKPLVWSLGTSVNSFGCHHHILLKVDSGDLIANAFMDLWDQLQSDDYLVWRCP